MKKDKLIELRSIIRDGDIKELSKETELFGGAGIKIVPHPQLVVEEEFYPVPEYVITHYAKELSWLIFKLKDIFNTEVDYLNKAEFYGRLADMANESLKRQDASLYNLLNDVIDEAVKFSELK